MHVRMPDSSSSTSWQQAILNRRMLICVFTGFVSGLPLYVLIQLVPAWLRVEGVDLKSIGLFALVGLPYAWKFLWAPFLDRFVIFALGRRRGWMLLSQLALLVSIALLGWLQPETSLSTIAWLCLAVAFFSATQDIAIDAYRRELLPDAELGLGNAIHVQAYRIASLVPGALGLILADFLPWSWVFVSVAGFMLVGVALTLAVDERALRSPLPKGFTETVIEPFAEFFHRDGFRQAGWILAFMFFYKLGDNMATALSQPFYIDLGFSLTEIGLIAKNAALWPSIVGGILGGLWMVRLGINRALWLFGLIQLITILGFAALSEIGPNKLALALVIGLEYLGVGLGTAAFTAFIARATSMRFAATQFALFTALAAVPRSLANALTGFLVEGGDAQQLEGFQRMLLEWLLACGLPASGLGWTQFFLLCTVCAVPGMVMLLKVAPWREQAKGSAQ